jgi:hypothetical protein
LAKGSIVKLLQRILNLVHLARPPDNDTVPLELQNCEELRTLQAKFSSGVCLTELGSIAIVIASIVGIKPPTRKVRRYYQKLIKWYHENWELVSVWLPFIELRDGGGMLIDHRREVFDHTLKRILK